MKMAALAAASASPMERRRSAEAKLASEEPDSPIYVAVNMSKVANNEEGLRLIKKVGTRVCITMATHPGFVAFQANIQTGIPPWPADTGAGKVHMEKELNPIQNYKYTMWKHWQDHDDFHQKQF